MDFNFGDWLRSIHVIMVMECELMKIAQCLCGWRGPEQTYRHNGKPTCPYCSRELFTIKCEGCSE